MNKNIFEKIIDEFIEIHDAEELNYVNKIFDEFNEEDILKINNLISFYFKKGLLTGIDLHSFLKNNLN